MFAAPLPLERLATLSLLLTAACTPTSHGSDAGPRGKADHLGEVEFDPNLCLREMAGEAVDMSTEQMANCETAQRIAQVFRSFMLNPTRPPPIKRAVFSKPHGCLRATFSVPDLEDEIDVGLFSEPASYDAWLRISSDTRPSTSDFDNKTVGFAIKVLDVDGDKILEGESDQSCFRTQDFLLQNHPVFFVDTADDFRDFITNITPYLNSHPRAAQIFRVEMKKPVGNVLRTEYWSTTPYRFGTEDHVKYSLRPCAPDSELDAGECLPETDEAIPSFDRNYLASRLARDLQPTTPEADQPIAAFALQVQLRSKQEPTNCGDDAATIADIPPRCMPLDRATIGWSETAEDALKPGWSESISPPRTVAIIRIHQHVVADNAEDCERMSFTAWHSLPAHRPVGSVNQARGFVYKRLADERRERIGAEVEEPAESEECGLDPMP